MNTGGGSHPADLVQLRDCVPAVAKATYCAEWVAHGFGFRPASYRFSDQWGGEDQSSGRNISAAVDEELNRRPARDVT